MTTNLEQLTPAQLRRVDALIADKVAGFIPCPAEYLYVPYYTADPAAALSLLDEYGDYYITRLTDAVDKPFRYRCGLIGYGDGEASTLPLAICSAVAEAEGLELGEVLNGSP